MKINKIYISAFGGLKDFTLELNDGLNIIFGENENGKSTVMAFIKMMFYGGKKTQHIKNSPRVKYAPWDGSAMGGRIDFEYENTNYRLEREFKKSDSTDRIVLTNTDTGEIIPTEHDVGNKFFGIGVSTFERCMFISTFGAITPDDNASGELNSKLSNLAVTGDEDTSYQTVVKRLETARNKLISKSGRAGKLTETANLLTELKAKLEKSHEMQIEKQNLNSSLDTLKGEYTNLLSRQKQIKAVVDSENDIRNAKKLKEYLDTKQKLDNLNEQLTLKNGTVLDEQFVKKTQFCINNVKRYFERCELIKGDIEKIKDAIKLQASPEETAKKYETVKNDIDKLNKNRSLLEEKERLTQEKLNEFEKVKQQAQDKKPKANPVFLILALILLICGIAVTAVINPITGIITAIIGIISLILYFTVRPKNNNELAKAQNDCISTANELVSIRNEKASLQEKINSLSIELNTLLSVLNSNSEIKKQRESDLMDKQNELDNENEKYNTAKKELLKLYSDYSENDDIAEIENSLIALSQKTDEQKNLKQQLMYLSRDLDNISYEQAERKLQSIGDKTAKDDTDFSKNRELLQDINEQISNVLSKITEKQTELKTGFRNTENPENIKKQINETAEKLKNGKEFCNACDIALEVLSSSFAEIRRSYGSELEKNTLEIFSKLTGGKYSTINVSKSLDISVEQSGVFGTRESDYLSNGTVDQAYLSLRLAISKLISENEQMPIFLDDTLSQYDDIRTARAVEFLKEYSIDTQTVMFTCHNSICDIAKSNGIAVKNIKN